MVYGSPEELLQNEELDLYRHHHRGAGSRVAHFSYHHAVETACHFARSQWRPAIGMPGAWSLRARRDGHSLLCARKLPLAGAHPCGQAHGGRRIGHIFVAASSFSTSCPRVRVAESTVAEQLENLVITKPRQPPIGPGALLYGRSQEPVLSTLPGAK